MTATVAALTGNQFGVLLAIFLLVSFVTCVVLWVHERRSDVQGDTIAEHAEQLATLAYQMPALLEYLGVDIPVPVVDDSPAAESRTQDAEPKVAFELPPGDDAKTDEFPVAPATVPDGIAIQVQAALIERPSPVPREPEMVERVVNIGGTLQTFHIPANREEAS